MAQLTLDLEIKTLLQYLNAQRAHVLFNNTYENQGQRGCHNLARAASRGARPMIACNRFPASARTNAVRRSTDVCILEPNVVVLF